MRLHKRDHQLKNCTHIIEKATSKNHHMPKETFNEIYERRRKTCLSCEKPKCTGNCELMKG